MADEPFLDTLDIAVLTAVGAIVLIFVIKKLGFGQGKPNQSSSTSAAGAKKPKSKAAYDERNFAAKMKHTNKNLIIFFGSQTGTAEEYATRLAKEGKARGFRPMTADFMDYDMDHFEELKDIDNCLVLFTMATYGEGDPTDNAQEFHDEMKDHVDNGDLDLSGIKFSVFGLGNKTYEKFNAMGRFVDATFKKLGATDVYPMGEGDDDANLEEDFATWKDGLWPSIADQFSLDLSSTDVFGQRQFKTQFYEKDELDEDRLFTGEVATLKSFVTQRRPFNPKNPFLAEVLVNRELYANSSRSCLHIELSIDKSGMRYHAGDHVGIYPVNKSALVEGLAKRLGCDLDKAFTMSAVDTDAKKQSPFPCPCSLRTAFTYYVDITSHPHMHVLRELAELTADPQEKEKLIKMASKEGKDLYQKWIYDDCRHILDVLNDMPGIKIEADHLLELLPRLQCRYYSISSSRKVHETAVHVTAAVVQYTTPLGHEREGVTTGWLKDLPVGTKIPVFIRQSTFRLPPDHKTPVIMVGPGTGLAPFRGFLQERDFHRKQGKPLGETILFFGCQKKAEHYLYQNELEQYVKEGTLSELHLAFSRDQAEKVYVQHHVAKNGKKINELLQKDGHFYICGDAKNMANDVHETLIKIVMEEQNKTCDQAENWLKTLSNKKRIQMDVW